MHLSSLYIYPIKSCAGTSLAEAAVTDMGLAGDRRWMLADKGGRFLTGREHPRLVQVSIALNDAGFVATAPDAEPLTVVQRDFTEAVPTGVWRQEFDAWRGSDEADDWFSFYLGLECQLLHIGAQPARRLKVDETLPMSFADGYPYLLIGENSLADLNSRLARPVSMRNFRPNLVVANAPAFAEDGWQRIRIGTIEFEMAKPCERCVFTTVDPDSGNLHPERQPLVTLGGYRRSEAGILFGMNVIARATGVLRVGDPVEVIA